MKNETGNQSGKQSNGQKPPADLETGKQQSGNKPTGGQANNDPIVSDEEEAVVYDGLVKKKGH